MCNVHGANGMPVTASTSASSEEPERDLWKPWPEYVELFRDRTEDAATVLQYLFHAQDSQIIPFLHSFPWIKPELEQRETLCSSGFPLALLKIASSRPPDDMLIQLCQQFPALWKLLWRFRDHAVLLVHKDIFSKIMSLLELYHSSFRRLYTPAHLSRCTRVIFPLANRRHGH
ncbi:hypothetical protein BC835DRAFT_1084874 [Cytidiella melzeri]|nr:hypothetical protein BC835DRAFT_1084874 [Cytidiella melzeri]